MDGNPAVLVVSSNLEYRRALVRVLDDLPVDKFVAATVAEAEDVLSRQRVALVFCDDRLTDGTYRDLLSGPRTCGNAPYLVVTTRTGEWKEYLEAAGLGAFDMIQYPYRPAEIELNVLRTMPGNKGQQSYRAVA